MWRESYARDLELWVAFFGDVAFLYPNLIRDLWLRPEKIADDIVLLRDFGADKISEFVVNAESNSTPTMNFFLYRKVHSEVILVYGKNTRLVFEENGKQTHKPDKVSYFRYRNTEIYQLYPRTEYHIKHELVKLLTPDGEIVINPALEVKAKQ
ncbi:MAG: hypothetical protein ACO2PP_26455 [Thermocrinis sp.]|jgi:hypothetical protein|uniref:hypothetical protein n=1 Tax=Thermocrinis sp. TaxID=2024383 RepID=UPI003C02AF2B